MPYKDPEKRREYNREYRRRKSSLKSSHSSEQNDFKNNGYLVRPWRRFFARYCDYILYCSIMGNLMYYVAPQFTMDFIERYSVYVLITILLLSWSFIEATLLSNFGSTIGKRLLNISVCNLLSNKLTYKLALKRSLKVFWLGMGLGIPALNIAANIYSYYIVKRDSVTTWDREGDILVKHNEINPFGAVTVAVIFITFLILNHYR